MIFSRIAISALILTAVITGPIACRKENPLLQPQGPKPGSADFYANEGLSYLSDGNLTAAEHRFQSALAKEPNHINANIGMGVVYLNMRNFNKSLSHFELLKRLSPNNYDIFNYLGIVFLELGQYESARQNLLVAATSDQYPTPENAYANLAQLELKLNNPDAAMRYLQKGIEKKKSFALLYSLEGQVHELQNRLQEALASYTHASNLLFNKDIAVLINLGRIQAKLGEKAKAIELLESSLGKAQNPQDRQAILELIAEINKQK